MVRAVNATGLELARPNVIIGGNFDTNPWQRGTTFTSISDGTYGADRFEWLQVGAGVIDLKKTADAPTVAEADFLVTNCLHLDVTTADGTIAATDVYHLSYQVEGYDFAQLAQREMTLSFWVKSTKTGIFCVGFRNSGDDRSFVAEYTINTTDTWEYKTIKIDASPSAGTWDYTNGKGIQISFVQAAGSNFQGTGGSWQSADIIATSNQVNGMDNAANNFKLALVKLESGPVATPYPVESVEEVTEKCRRYFFKTFNVGVAPATGTGNNGTYHYNVLLAGANNFNMQCQFPSLMRATPSVTFYNPGAANTNWRNISGGADSGASSVAVSGDGSISIQNAQAAGDGVGNSCVINFTAAAEL